MIELQRNFRELMEYAKKEGTIASKDVVVDNHNVAAILAGMVIGTMLPLPSSPVEKETSYYLNTHVGTSTSYVGALNEAVPLNIDMALKLALKVWRARYEAVYKPFSVAHLDLMKSVWCHRNPHISEVQTEVFKHLHSEAMSATLNSMQAWVDRKVGG